MLDELKKREREIKEGKFIDEEELFDFLKKKGAIIEWVDHKSTLSFFKRSGEIRQEKYRKSYKDYFGN